MGFVGFTWDITNTWCDLCMSETGVTPISCLEERGSSESLNQQIWVRNTLTVPQHSGHPKMIAARSLLITSYYLLVIQDNYENWTIEIGDLPIEIVIFRSSV